jgi:hypothetical protein
MTYPDINDTWSLAFAPPLIVQVTSPGDIAWSAGSASDFHITAKNLDPLMAQTVDYTLVSERNWPGFPISGSTDLPAGATVQIPLSVPVPDTAAPGLNDLTFTVTPRLAGEAVVCSFHIHDVTTATTLALVSASAQPDRVLLCWFAADASGLVASVERRVLPGVWQTQASIVADGTGRLQYDDPRVEPGARYGYRLLLADGPAPRYSAETWIDVPVAPRFALSGLRPNPAGTRPSVAFSLPDAEPVRLQLVDIGGRRVVDRLLAGLGPGPHIIDLEEAQGLPSGIYFVRLSHGPAVLIARGVLVR